MSQNTLKLVDLIKLAGVQTGKFKIHLATGGNDHPLTAFFDGRFKEWQEHQTKRNFQCDSVVALIHLNGSHWLFAGLWRIEGWAKRSSGGKPWYKYSTTEIQSLDHLSGRAIVTFKRTFRASYLIGERYADKLEVVQVLEERMSMGEFPGYSSLMLDYRQLRHVFRHELAEWRSALRSVKGVYVITDTSCGKLYVGGAYGTGGFWERWSDYAKTSHGKNKELRELLRKRGKTHAEKFLFAILEVCDVKATKDEVIARETHWKRTLQTREYGYNAN